MEVCYIGFSFHLFLNSISTNIIELRHFSVYHQIAGTLSIPDPLSKSRLNTMRSIDEDLTDTTCYKTEKRGNKFLYICMIHEKLTLKKNSRKKKTTKKGVNGIRTHIHENRWLLVYIYSKNERSTYCAIESLEN